MRYYFQILTKQKQMFIINTSSIGYMARVT